MQRRRVPGSNRRCDTTLCVRGAPVVGTTLSQNEDTTHVDEFDRRTQSGNAAPDDQKVTFDDIQVLCTYGSRVEGFAVSYQPV